MNVSDRPQRPCVRCRRRAADPAFRPFCSKRCADADLGLWLTGSYVVPGSAEAGEAPPSPGLGCADERKPG